MQNNIKQRNGRRRRRRERGPSYRSRREKNEKRGRRRRRPSSFSKKKRRQKEADPATKEIEEGTRVFFYRELETASRRKEADRGLRSCLLRLVVFFYHLKKVLVGKRFHCGEGFTAKGSLFFVSFCALDCLSFLSEMGEEKDADEEEDKSESLEEEGERERRNSLFSCSSCLSSLACVYIHRARWLLHPHPVVCKDVSVSL